MEVLLTNVSNVYNFFGHAYTACDERGETDGRKSLHSPPTREQGSQSTDDNRQQRNRHVGGGLLR